MEAHQVFLLQILGVLLVFHTGSLQGKSIAKTSSNDADSVNLETELSRVKRLTEDAVLSRQKRGGELEESPGLSRVKRQNLDETPSLSRVKRQDLEDVELSRVKRTNEEDPALSRQKRRDLDEAELSRVKRNDLDALSRQKRKDPEQETELSRVKRDEQSLTRVKRTDLDLPELSRVKRTELSSRRRRDVRDTVDKKDVEESDSATDQENLEKKASVERDADSVEKESPNKRNQLIKRKRGYWEKRTRGDYLIHRANKRYHKRRYNNKRGRSRFMKKKKSLSKQKMKKQAKSEKEFVKKSLAKETGNH